MSDKKIPEVPASFTKSIMTFINEEANKEVKKDLKKRGLGTLSMPDTRGNKQRTEHKNKMATRVWKNFKKTNPQLAKRFETAYKKK